MYLFTFFLYRTILDLSYYLAISPLYNYSGMIIVKNEIIVRLIISYALMFALYYFTPKNKNKLISVFLNLQLIIMIIPMLSFYSIADKSLVCILCVSIVHCIQILFYKILFKKPNFKYYSSKSMSSSITVLVVMIFLVSVYSTYSYGRLPSFDVLNFNKVYLVREHANMPYWAGYFISWSSMVIIPFMFCFNFINKKYVKCILWGGCQFIFYLVYANKFMLLIIPAMIGICIVSMSKYLYVWITSGLSLLMIFFLFMYKFYNIIMPIAIVPNRLLYIPAQIKFAYYEFFSYNQKVFFADGLVGKLFSIKSPYEYTIPQEISKYLYKAEVPFNANTGYLADSFANGGYVGLLLISVILIVFIYFLDCLSYKISRPLAISSSFFIFMILNDGAFQTTILTGGSWLLIIIYFSLSKKKHLRITNI